MIGWETQMKKKGKKAVEVDVTTRRWTKPPDGSVKLNVDGSFSESPSTGGAGMVLRDHTGDVIVSACRFLSHCQSPLEEKIGYVR